MVNAASISNPFVLVHRWTKIEKLIYSAYYSVKRHELHVCFPFARAKELWGVTCAPDYDEYLVLYKHI